MSGAVVLGYAYTQDPSKNSVDVRPALSSWTLFKSESEVERRLWLAWQDPDTKLQVLIFLLTEIGYVWCDTEENAYSYWLKSREALSHYDAL